jgi:VCBS repeat-containing protein
VGVKVDASVEGVSVNIWNNLIYDNTNQGLVIHFGGSGTGYRVENNTIYQAVGDAVKVEGSAQNVKLANNILWVDLGNAISVEDGSQTGFTSDYNLFYLGSEIDASDNLVLWGATGYTSLEAWQTDRSQDLHGRYGAPNFLDMDGADNVFGGPGVPEGSGEDDNFGLRPNRPDLSSPSPAIDAANAYVASFEDILGRPRHDDLGTVNTGAGWDFFDEADTESNQFAEGGVAQSWRSTGASWLYTLPFTFSFYGKDYTQVYVSSDGFLHFEGPDTRYGDNSIDVFKRNTRIAPLWDNLRTSGTGENIYIDSVTAGQVTIRWAGSLENAPNTKVNFSVTLFQDGSFRFDYGSTGNTDLTPTIGISAGNGEVFEFSAYNGFGNLAGANSVMWTLEEGLTYFDIGAYEFQGDSNDETAPSIEGISNLPAQSTSAPGDSTAAAFSSIQIEFSEALDVISARSSANYKLIQAGPDDVFDNLDDLTLTLNPAYAFDSETVTLEFADGILPDGNYRLTLSGTGAIYDTAGNALDGDANGTGGDDYVHYFVIYRSGNTDPVAGDQDLSLNEDGSLIITLTGSDVNLGDILNFSIKTGPTHGTLSALDPVTHQLTYTPTANYNQTDSFTFRVDDGKLGEDEGVVSITVNAINDEPTAVNQSITMSKNTSKLIVLQGNDLETIPANLSFAIDVDPTQGTLLNLAPNAWTYTPAADYVGSDSFTFTVTDGGDPDGTPGNDLTSSAGTMSITVIEENQAPVLEGISPKTVSEGSLLSFTVTADDPDAGSTLTYSLDAGPTGAAINPTTGLFTWTPPDGPRSADVTVRVTDSGTPSLSGTESFSVTVNNVAPALVISGASTVKEGQVYTLNLASSDPGQDTIPGWEISWGDGQVEIFIGNPGSATHTYATPGSVLVSATATDEDGTYSSNELALEVRPLNSPPDAVADEYSVDEDNPLIVELPGVLGNDSDIDGNNITASLVSEPSHGILTLNPDGGFTYTPTANFYGVDSFVYVANDGALNSGEATVLITVNPVNDVPTTGGIADVLVNEDDPDTVVNLFAAFQDVEDADSSLVCTIESNTNPDLFAATAINAGLGTLTLDYALNAHGVSDITVRATDSGTLFAEDTFRVTVNPVNDAPIAYPDDAVTAEDTAVTIAFSNLLANDVDVDEDAVTLIAVNNAVNGDVALDGDGNPVFTPSPNFNGTGSFEYTISDGKRGTDTASVTVTVTPVNDAPVATNDNYATDEDTALIISAPGLLANDTDVDGDALSAGLVNGPTSGVLAFNSDGSFTYTPNIGFSGTDSFTYRSNDGTADSGVATVTVNVGAVNDAPVANVDVYAVDEDQTLDVSTDGVLTNDTDADGDSLIALLLDGPANGTLSLNPNGSFTYAPAANFNGEDSFTYKANDGSVDSNTATVTITVNAVNDVPTTSGIANVTVDEDAPDTMINLFTAFEDVEDTDSALTYTVVNNTRPTLFTSTTINGVAGTLMLDYAPDAYGSADITMRAADTEGAFVETVFTVTLNAVNDPPAANPETAVTAEDTPITVLTSTLLANDTDVDGDVLTVTGVNKAVNGSVVISDGSLIFTPSANFNGEASFEYAVSDGNGGTDTTTVTITVTPVNDVPNVVNDVASTEEDVPVTIQVLANDSDVDDDTLSISGVTQGAHGTVTVDGGVVTYSPNPDFYGSDSFSYEASDDQGGSTIGTVAITVNPVNDAPVLAKIEDRIVNEGTIVSFTASATDGDLPEDTLTYSLEAGAPAGAVIDPVSGVFTWTITEAQGPGSYGITVRVTDSTGLLSTAPFGVGVLEVNEAPVLGSVGDKSLDELTELTFTLSATDSDLPANTLTFSAANLPEGASLDPGTRTFTWTPTEGQGPGNYEITFQVSDGEAADSETIRIDVAEVNSAPTLAPVGNQTINEGEVLSFAVSGSDSDLPVQPLTYGATNLPDAATFDTSTGLFSWTPSEEQGPGTYEVTFAVSDGTVTAEETVTITVNEENVAPVANDDAYTTDEDQALVVAAPGVLINDSDVDGDSLTASLVTGPSSGELVFNEDGSFSYTPGADWMGTDSFTYTVSDGFLTNTGTALITVTSVNDAPVANDNAYTTDEDTLLTIPAPGVLGNDTDVDASDVLTVASVDATGTLGVVAWASDGSFTYNPNGQFDSLGVGESVTDSFIYTMNDGHGSGDAAAVTITITGENDAPVAVDDTANTLQDTPVVIPLLTNDMDVDGDALAIASFTQPAHGTVADNGDGSLTYTPSLGFTGEDGFTYTAYDGMVDSNVAMVMIAVTPVGEVTIDAGDQANDGSPDTFRMGRRGDSIEVLVNDRVVFTAPLATAPLLKFTGSGDNDILIVDYSGGNPIPEEGISYDGGGIGDNDTLIMTGGSVSDVTHTFTSVDSGMADMEGSTISYTGIEGITDSLVATDRGFVFGDAGDTITIGEDLTPGNNVSRISSVDSSVAVNFMNPVNSLTVNAGDGNDRITVGSLDRAFGTSFDVVIDGAEGDDYINASRADFSLTLIGGSGNDTLLGGRGNDVMNGGDGSDILWAGSGDDTLLGGSGNDVLDGGAGNDVLRGGEGNDLITGGNGNDTLHGDSGYDLLTGANGNDVIDGGDGNDILSGDNGNDILLGSNGNDLMMGGNGNDELWGGAGNDILLGGLGNDILEGGPGNDFVYDLQDRNRFPRISPTSSAMSLESLASAGNNIIDISIRYPNAGASRNGDGTTPSSASWVADFVSDLAIRNDRNPNNSIQVILR